MSGVIQKEELSRKVFQIGVVEGIALGVSERKDIVRLVDGLSLGTVTAKAEWQIDPGAKASVLWDITKGNEWIEALVEEAQVERLYIATKQNAAFKKLAEEIKETLPPLTREKEAMRPMAAGFDENLAYFELGFLDPGEVARGQQFAAILPLLWMLAGAKSECPKPGRISKWLIAPECGFAVLHNEELFIEFRDELKGRKEIEHIFLVTDSEDTFKEMRAGLRKGLRSHMLYSSYLRNFGINIRPTS